MNVNIAIELRESSGEPLDEKGLFFGLLAIVEAQSGEYTDQDGLPVLLEMEPPERNNNRQAIAITSEKFVGHERGAGYRGSSRRVVDISKKSHSGSLPIDSYRKVVVRMLAATNS